MIDEIGGIDVIEQIEEIEVRGSLRVFFPYYC